MARLVSKCVCNRITFQELKDLLLERKIRTIQEIKDENLACSGCGMCTPYVQKMLVTGQVEFKPGEYHIK